MKTFIYYLLFFPELVKRFDDVSAVVRLKSARVLAALFKNLPENYNPSIQSARLRDLYESATVFLDDPDEILQGAVSGTQNYVYTDDMV